MRLLDKVFYSLDKIHIVYRLRVRDCNNLMDMLAYDTAVTVKTSHKLSFCAYNYYCDTPDGESFYIGVNPNHLPHSNFEAYVRLEYNPSKVSDLLLYKVLCFLNGNTSPTDRVVKRFDLAIDFPVPREKMYLVKDNRTYKDYANSSSDRTQYLGHHHQHGFIKLYNKALEMQGKRRKKDELPKTPIDLTRLEITIEHDKRNIDEVNRLIPKLYILDDFPFEVSMTGTDKVLIVAILGDITLLNELPRKKKEKISAFLEKMQIPYKIDEVKYNHILSEIDEITNRNMY